MFTSAELIEALRRRMRRSLRPPPPPGEFPPGWRDWFAAMAAQPGRVAGAAAGDIVAVVAARGPAVSSDVVQALGRWRAFTSLWRQDWQPASRDERWTRIASMSATLLLHLLFAVMLAWLMFTRFHFPGAVEDARDGEEHVLQVEYIGEGTPADTGGGAPEAPVESPDAPAPAAAPASTASVAPSVPAPEAAQVPVDAPPEAAPDVLPPPLPERELTIELPELAPPSVPARQELQVTEVDIPDSRFVVPPPRDLAVEVPEAVAQDVSVRRRDIDVEATTRVPVPTVRVPREVEASVRDAAPQGVAVVERRIELAEVADVAIEPSRSLPAAAIRQVPVEAPAVRTREVPMPSARPAPATAGAGDTARGQASSTDTRTVAGEGSAAAPAATPPGGRPDAGSGTRSTGIAPGAGQQPGQPPGAMPTTRASDDWGDSTRHVPGRQAGTPGASGLFNADGSPRLADSGRVGGGLPPGTITEDFENIDRHGTWLKRPPYDYEPTAFDQFWLPGEDLLEEWVRRSVTEVLIPIPGTTKTIRCVTVLLALGGGCGIVDPNLQEQPAGARKPPDVPFKRELQEDQESLGPPPPES
ncbi:hypothetical protein [Luteimonas terricola]|uniref:Transmembrane repetitive protein n=1 Tax=Luteimonas terricola TaxID=645597 RepID=A0ABQ2EFA2_9GAMM|nr:hypothetical protein [Luteimonas terricola]GGK06696.1 hypothetical protein GCM10011394_14860 [Luteimonas terricola]